MCSKNVVLLYQIMQSLSSSTTASYISLLSSNVICFIIILIRCHKLLYVNCALKLAIMLTLLWLAYDYNNNIHDTYIRTYMLVKVKQYKKGRYFYNA